MFGGDALRAVIAKLGPLPPLPDAYHELTALAGCAELRPDAIAAVVERDASLVRGRNVLRTRKLGTGIYEVFFTGDVSNGAFVATIGRPGIATEPPGEITMALRCCPGLGLFEPFEGNKGVWIQTFDSAGKPSDRSFHLIVLTH